MPRIGEIDAEVGQVISSLFERLNANGRPGIDDVLREISICREAFFAFYDRHPEQADSGPQDEFFSALTPIWVYFSNNGLHREAQQFWEQIIFLTEEWEQQRGAFIHKGSPFYFWGVSAARSGLVDVAFLLMHSAFREDQRTSAQAIPYTPAFMFVTFDQDPRQYYFEYIQGLADYLQNFITTYRILAASNFDIQELRQRFLRPVAEVQAAFSFTYSLAKLREIDSFPTPSLRSAFAAQQELNILFDLLLVVDFAIHNMNPNAQQQRSFLHSAVFLSNRANLMIEQNDLITVLRQAEIDFDQTLFELLNNSFVFPDGTTKRSLANNLALCYILRNHAAHNLTSFPTISARFRDIRQGVLNILFLSVETLY
jgi:hypothetical protein